MDSVVTIAPSILPEDELADFEGREKQEQELEDNLNRADLDIRPALKPFEATPDEDQLSFICASDHQIVRLVAPAGSGKTQTVIHRVLQQIRTGTPPERILCLTFDKSAVTALQEKIAGQLHALGIDQAALQIMTLNAFGRRILKELFPEEFRHEIEDRPARLIAQARRELARTTWGRELNDAIPGTLGNKFLADFVRLLKNSLFDPRGITFEQLARFMLQDRNCRVLVDPQSSAGEQSLVIEAMLGIYKLYEQLLQRERRIDFEDQKLRALRCLADSPRRLTSVQRRYDVIIVDEFQDINRLDFALISAVAEQARLIVAGDDDQAIYGFRGCTPSYIIDLEKHIGSQVRTFELRRNYRTPRNVVEHATRLIRNNTWRIAKSPIAVRNDDASIKVVESRTATAEAKMIAAALTRIRRNADVQYHDFTVLYRTNAQSLPIQLHFILRDIPYNVREEDNILRNEELEKLLGILRAKLALGRAAPVHPTDALLTVKAYFAYVDASAARRLQELFSASPSFLDTVRGDRFFSILPRARQSRFAEAVNEVVRAPSLFKTLDLLRGFKGLRGMVGSLEDVVDGDVPLGEVYELAASFRGKIETFVETIDGALRRARELRAGREQKGVALATFFKAKGLQWHTVVITSCNDGIIPHQRAPIDDERKLFYVALTRASSNLIISYLRSSCKTKVSPSRFLGEAGLLNLKAL